MGENSPRTRELDETGEIAAADQSGIGLGETLRLLRAELANSTKSAANDPVRLRIDSLDVGLQFTVTRTVGGSGGVKFWVVTADAKAERESSATHTVTLHMTALTKDGGEVVTSDTLRQVPR